MHGADGLAAGVAASLAMIALLTMALTMRKRTPGTGLGWVSVLTVVITGTFILAFRATAPPTVNVNHVPYVVTTGLAVAGMAYAATLAASCIAVIGWGAVRLIRKAPSQHGSAADQPRCRRLTWALGGESG